MIFVSIILIPLTWHLVVPLWHIRKWKASMQYYLGLVFFVCGGPFLAICVLVYALINMDRFGWGKTRKVVKELEPGEPGYTESEKPQRQRGMIAEVPHQTPETLQSLVSPARPAAVATIPGRRPLDEENRLGWM